MMFVMSMVVFAIILAPPGDFVSDYVAQLEEEGDLTSVAEAEALRRHFGLTEPVYVQYWKWISGVIRWDMGDSLSFQRPVTDLINDRLMMTVILGLLTIVFTWTMAIPIGIISAVKQYSVIDYFFTFLSYLGVGTPNFMLALVMMYTALSVFNWSVLGLFSFEYVDAPWSFGKVRGYAEAHLGAHGHPGDRRDGALHPGCAGQPAGRAEQALRGDGPRQGAARVEGGAEVSRPHRPQPLRQHRRLVAAGALLRQPDRRHRDEPPHHRAACCWRRLLVQDMYIAGSIILILTGLTVIGTLISDIILAWMDPRIRIRA